MERRAVIAVTHLLGVGHLTRAAALGRGLARAGWHVTLVSGGAPAPLIPVDGLELVQLPPLHCVGTDFKTLLGPDGTPADADMLVARAERMREAVLFAAPHVVITELYPFGRRQLRAEFEALLVAAHGLSPRPAILSSIRDVPNPPSSSARADETLATLARFFDAVLVHGDPDFVPLAASWPVVPALARRLRPTGYVHDAPRSDAGVVATDEIVVSGGGSAAGLPLCRTAVAAARLMPGLAWRVLAGHGIPAMAFDALKAEAPDNVTVERARRDFAALLAACRVSVSQAGYNTVLDLAAAGARAVLVPFAEGGEQEQTLRAAALAQRGLVTVLPASALTAEDLASAVRSAAAEPRPDWSSLRRDGITESVALVESEARRAIAIDAAWRRLGDVLAALSAAGRVVPAWLRDDDAVAASAPLTDFLARLSARGVPVAIATVPAKLEASLGALIESAPEHALLVHGWSHASHAPPGDKTSEYPSGRDSDRVRAELTEGLRRVRAVAPSRSVAVFVPPWNRMSPAAASELPALGYRALSASAASRRLSAVFPPRLDVHWDPIDWRGSRGLADEVMLLDRLSRLLAEELEDGRHVPLGLLTHHAVHDGWIDRFLDAVIDRLQASGAVRFLSADAALDRLPPAPQ